MRIGRSTFVERDFAASRPDELWFADFTYLRFWEGVVYFAFVIDAYRRAIVGWQFAAHMRTDLVLDALRMALAQRGAGADVVLVHQATPATSTPRSATPRSSTTTACSPQSAASATPMTTDRQELHRQLEERADPRPGAPANGSSSPLSGTSPELAP
jgi:hypothetical protein